MIPRYLYIPFIPLPNVVFFPQALLPLHIFEPRYRRMVEAILTGDRLMGVALLKPGWEETYYESPPVYRVFGIGKIVEHEKLPNGNFDIWLSGLERVEILNEVQQKPFRVAKVQTLDDDFSPYDGINVSVARRELTGLSRQIIEADSSFRGTFAKGVEGRLYPGALADFAIGHLCPDIYERQCVLNEVNVVRRLRLVSVQARLRLREALERRQAHSAQPGATVEFPLPDYLTE